MFLMIRNPGVADAAAFTLLGVSTTRSAGVAGTIGQFGSGSKNSLALLLRTNVNPVIICGNLKMDFFSKPKMVSGQQFDQVCVKYSGKEIDGTSKTSTDDLGFTLQWGIQDWNKTSMALREFVANAIDAATRIEDLRLPPSNHLELLKSKRHGQWSIRLNDQWRICFLWINGNAEKVEIIDYH